MMTTKKMFKRLRKLHQEGKLNDDNLCIFCQDEESKEDAGKVVGNIDYVFIDDDGTLVFGQHQCVGDD